MTARISGYQSSGCRTVLILGLFAVLSEGAITNLSAQEQSPPLKGDETLCMARAKPDGSHELPIVLQSADSEAMRAIGFVEIACSGAFETHSDILEWRDKACEMAADPDGRMQEVIKGRFGARPAVFCGMAEAAVGQWQVSKQEGN